MMTRSQRRNVWILFAVIFVACVALSDWLAPGHEQYMAAGSAQTPGQWVQQLDDAHKSPLGNSSFEGLLPTLLGIREVLASLMWVQADDYFHRGEYRPIIRMVRQIVMIDPHQIDVYATGAWHMAYNFMDKRLIQDGVEFLKDGCKNNEAVYDLYFELGYMHYDKTKDFRQAVAAYGDGANKGTTTGKKEAPAYVRHQLAHAMEKLGDVDACIEQWKINVAKAAELEHEGESKIMTAGPNTDAARHNLYITQRRRNERLAVLAERAGNAAEAQRLWQANADLAKARLTEGNRTDVQADMQTAQGNVERLQTGKLRPSKPTDLDIHFTITRLAPRRIQVEGICNAINLSRVNVLFRDKDYDQRIQQGFDFRMTNCTLEWDNVSVQKEHFKKLFEFDKDPADMDRPAADVYPLNAPQYDLVLTYNPRLQAAFIQDIYGWSGESLVSKHLIVDNDHPGILFGKKYPLRMVRKQITLSRDDILGAGKKVLYSDL